MTVYYVHPTGSDLFAGSGSSIAWNTIFKVVSYSSSFVAGDQILFAAGGTWREQFIVNFSGSVSSPIIIDKYGIGKDPIITGADVVSSFNNGGSNIWDATGISTRPNILFITGVIGILATTRGNVTAAGAWFWTGSTNTLSVFSNVDPSTTIEIGQRDHALVATGSSNITLKNIEFKAGNSTTYGTITAFFGTNGSNNWTASSCTFSGSAGNGIQVFGSGFYIFNCQALWNVNFGIYCAASAASGAIISNSVIHHNGTSGMTTVNKYSIIKHSMFYQDGWNTNSPAHGVYLYAVTGTLVEDCIFSGYNRVRPNGRTDSGIRQSGILTTVRRNTFKSSSHGIDLVDAEGYCSGNLICYNLFYDMTDRSIFIGGARQCGIYHNTFEGITGSTFQHIYFGAPDFSNASGNIIYNNVFSTGSTYIYVETAQTAGFTADYNMFLNDVGTKFGFADSVINFSTYKTLTGQENNSTINNPLFVSTQAKDFRLRPNSPARNIGIIISGIDQVVCGSMPDLGVYEYSPFAYGNVPSWNLLRPTNTIISPPGNTPIIIFTI